MRNKVEELLETRAQDYGDAKDMAMKVVAMFNRLRAQDLVPEDLFYIMILLKLARESNKHKDDNCDDLCGYTELLKEIMNYKKSETN